MAAQLRRAAASLIAIVTRSHGFSSLVTRSTASSSSLISPECSSSVFHLRRFLPFSTCSADSPLQTSHKPLPEAEFRKGKEEPSATPKESSNAHVEFFQTGCLTLYLETNEERLAIHVEEKTNDDCSKTSLKMQIKLVYGYTFSKLVEFDIALPNGQGQVAIHTATTSVDDYVMEYIQELMDKFKGLLQKGGFNCKIEYVVKLAKELKEFKKQVVPKSESEHAEPPKNWSLNLNLETKDEIIEIKVSKKDNDKGLWMYITFMCGDNLNKNMEFDVELLDGQGQIAIRDVRISVDRDLQPDNGVQHLDEFTGLLEKRGLNYSNLDLMVKYAKEMKEIRATAVSTSYWSKCEC